MTDNQQPTICKECKHCIKPFNVEPGFLYETALCKARPIEDWVEGGTKGYRKCVVQNDNGRCPEYEPAEQAAQADGEGVQNA